MLCVVPTTEVPLLQEYVLPEPAFALKVTEAPVQIVVVLAVIVALGRLLTITVVLSVFVHPPEVTE